MNRFVKTYSVCCFSLDQVHSSPNPEWFQFFSTLITSWKYLFYEVFVLFDESQISLKAHLSIIDGHVLFAAFFQYVWIVFNALRPVTSTSELILSWVCLINNDTETPFSSGIYVAGAFLNSTMLSLPASIPARGPSHNWEISANYMTDQKLSDFERCICEKGGEQSASGSSSRSLGRIV